MIIPRHITDHLRELCRYYPILSLTGPRQAGKTTLLRHLFPAYQYVSLEDPDKQLRATEDPIGFLHGYDQQVIFDEAQRVPSLFSYLQAAVDADRQPGRFILSGSQNFLLRQGITQSLAGRVGVAKLFPLDIQEMKEANQCPADFETALFRGFYPAQFDTGIPARLFYPSYMATYLERDVSGLISAANLTSFQRFLQLCATYAGQLLNYSAMANTIGVSAPTIQNWISVLEQSYVLFRLPPFFRNFGKRLIKSPKLYFYDTGLVCHLLGMRSAEDVRRYFQAGALFENLIVADRMKWLQHMGEEARLYFYRDSNQVEMDLLEEQRNSILAIEIKAARTFREKMVDPLSKIARIADLPVQKRLVYGGDENFSFKDVEVVSWNAANRDTR